MPPSGRRHNQPTDRAPWRDKIAKWLNVLTLIFGELDELYKLQCQNVQPFCDLIAPRGLCARRPPVSAATASAACPGGPAPPVNAAATSAARPCGPAPPVIAAATSADRLGGPAPPARAATASAARRSRPTLRRSLSWSHPTPLPPLGILLESVTLPPTPMPPGVPRDPIDERFPRRRPRRRRSFP